MVVLTTVMDMMATMGAVVELTEGPEEVDADRAVNHMEARCTVH